MREITRVVEYDGMTGRNKVTINVRRGYEVVHYRDWLDGYVHEYNKTEERESTEISIECGNGMVFDDLYISTATIQGKTMDVLKVRLSDRKIGLLPDAAVKVKAALAEAIREAETDNEDWTKIVEERKRREAENADYERHVRNVDRMMTLDGHTY